MKSRAALLMALAGLTTSVVLTGCGGGGGGGGSSDVLYYPYENVYGDVCETFEPTPGCTFHVEGGRIDVAEDPHYDDYGNGSDDMWFVEFDIDGDYGYIYDELGNLEDVRPIEDFAGWVGGSQIGVGTTGLFWEDVSAGTYWLGKNGVLYNAMSFESNFGEAINNETADDAADTNLAVLASEANTQLVNKAADSLVNEYGFEQDKAQAVASALNRWGVAAHERGYTTTSDLDATFKKVFGVDYSDALAAVNDFRKSADTSGLKDITNRSAAALGLKPHQAQKFIKGMYSDALANWGYDVESLSW